ncbi:MAG: hypothetical protein JWQ40_2199 [Segetibacter sp.]|nr:hypothetical protein [Segetibacter sp.]
MKVKLLQLFAYASCLCLLTWSCKKEALDNVGLPPNSANLTAPPPTQSSGARSSRLIAKAGSIPKVDEFSDYLSKRIARARLNKNVVVPSQCGPTALDKVIDKYFSKFGPLEFDWFFEYIVINQFSTLIDVSKQYFGANGQYTPVVVKHQKTLEPFWKMFNEIKINGQHNSTLNSRDKIAEVLIYFFGFPTADAYAFANEMIAINIISPVFIETPLLSFDAFATTNEFIPLDADLIVLSDGIIEALSETGIGSNVVVGGVLSHEWGHQVQFNYSKKWYGVELGAWPSTPDFTRFTEMEADCFSGYYLTHNKGAQYNWRQIAQFLYLFYTIGDCAFTDPGHHGTPNQRFAASRLGFLIAELTFPRSKVLSADQVHELYSAGYDHIIKNSINLKQALARLKTEELKAIFAKIVIRKTELQSIANGSIDKNTIENLR